MVRGELGRWKRILFEAPLYGLLVLTLLLGLGAYQARRPHSIDVGGIHDAPYLHAFHESEQDSEQKVGFRWTRDRVGLDLAGLGRQAVEVRLRLQAYRPAPLAAPEVSLRVGGRALFSTTVAPQWQVYQALVPGELLAGGDLYLELHAETFQPADDPRDLGVTVDWIEVRPAGLGWVEPAWGQLGCLLGVTLLSYLLLRRGGLSRTWSSLLVILGSASLAYLLACQRLALTYFTLPLVLLLAAAVPLTAVFLPLLERWAGRQGQVRQSRLVWAILLLGALLRLGGMLYPQFRSSDVLLHVHNAEYDVRSGSLFFTEPLPNVNLPAPYPPGLYVAFQPLTLFSDDLPVLMEVFGVALDAAAGALLYFLARRLSGRRDVALLALLLQQLAPVTYLIFSWGNYTNMFSRVALLAVLALLAAGRWRYGQARGWLLLTGSFVLVLLGHFADSLILGVLVLLTVALGLGSRSGRRPTPVLLASLGVAGAAALLLYYSAPVPVEALLEGVPLLLQGQGRSQGLVNPVGNLLDFLQAPVVLLALPGLALLPRRVRSWPGAVLGAALLTALLFGLAYALFASSTRYDYFVLPVLALGAGCLLASLRNRGWAGRWAVGALLLYLVWNCVWTWVQAISLYRP